MIDKLVGALFIFFSIYWMYYIFVHPNKLEYYKWYAIKYLMGALCLLILGLAFLSGAAKI